MKEPYEAIIRLLEEANMTYELLEHEPVYTSEQAAAARGADLSSGAKALLFKTKEGGFVLVVLPADERADSKKIKALVGTKDLRFASPEEVEEKMGCKIGACYPFGNIAGLRTIVDPSLAQNEFINFNPGRHDRSLKMRYDDYLVAAKPELATIRM